MRLSSAACSVIHLSSNASNAILKTQAIVLLCETMMERKYLEKIFRAEFAGREAILEG